MWFFNWNELSVTQKGGNPATAMLVFWKIFVTKFSRFL